MPAGPAATATRASALKNPFGKEEPEHTPTGTEARSESKPDDGQHLHGAQDPHGLDPVAVSPEPRIHRAAQFNNDAR
jgi:hypothetical protein